MDGTPPEQPTYTLSTDEVSARLGLSNRHVRRMAAAGILKALQESTRQGRQWFFNEDDVERLRSMREEMRPKEERHEVAKQTFGHVAEDDRGQPRSPEDMSDDDLTRVSVYQKMLDEEREAHRKTQEKLDESQADLREESTKAARLEGEKEGFRLGHQQVVGQQEKLIAMLAEKLQLQAPPTSDVGGQVAEDDRGQPRTFVEASEVVFPQTEPAPKHEDATPTAQNFQDAPHEPPRPAFDIPEAEDEEPLPRAA